MILYISHRDRRPIFRMKEGHTSTQLTLIFKMAQETALVRIDNS